MITLHSLITKYRTYVIIVLLCILATVLAAYSYFQDQSFRDSEKNKNGENPNIVEDFSPNLSITPSLLQSFQSINTIPTIQIDTEEKGLDLNSPEIITSKQSVASIKNALPYNKTITTSQGLTVEILIPPYDLLENEWTLTAHIFGVDYQVPQSDPEYQKNMYSFQEAAQEVFTFLQEHDISPSSIIIQWGDRAFIQERSSEWLYLLE